MNLSPNEHITEMDFQNSSLGLQLLVMERTVTIGKYYLKALAVEMETICTLPSLSPGGLIMSTGHW